MLFEDVDVVEVEPVVEVVFDEVAGLGVDLFIRDGSEKGVLVRM